jgi:pimeloyl-ACP methyl ester carboxylesterase
MDGNEGRYARSIKFARINGAELGYMADGSGEPIVFVHGALSDLRTWAPQAEAFSDRFTVITYSRRSHVFSESGGEYSRSTHSWDLIGLLEALGIESAHLVGHSYGASVALLTALRRPDLVRSLILGEASPFPELLDDEGLALLADQKNGFAEAERLASEGRNEESAAQFLRTIVGADVLPVLPEEARAVVISNSVTMLPMLETYYASPRLGMERLNAVDCPTLVVTGEHSPRISKVSDACIARRIADSRPVSLLGASHGLQIENPEGFNELLANFLSNVAP